jgi:hypothetical protein
MRSYRARFLPELEVAILPPFKAHFPLWRQKQIARCSLILVSSMKRVVPVAVGLAAGMAVGFFLGAMVTRHAEPIVVIHNATDETLRWVQITTDFHKSLSGVPEGASYGLDKLQPHHTWTERLSSYKVYGVERVRYHSRWQKTFERES